MRRRATRSAIPTIIAAYLLREVLPFRAGVVRNTARAPRNVARPRQPDPRGRIVMTLGNTGLDTSRPRLSDETDEHGAQQAAPQSMQEGQTQQINVGDTERAVSVAAGAIAAMAGLGRGGLPGLLITAIGGGLIYRGATGHCPMYQSLDVNTAEDGDGQSRLESSAAVNLSTSLLINRAPQELYD